MQTYAEVRGAKPINWWNRLEQLKEIKKKLPKSYYHGIPGTTGRMHAPQLTDKEFNLLEDSVNAASRWTTCACGNQCSIIPRGDGPFSNGEPIDSKLNALGVDFYTNIKRVDIDAAVSTLHQIEERSAYLIKEIRLKEEQERIKSISTEKEIWLKNN